MLLNRTRAFVAIGASSPRLLRITPFGAMCASYSTFGSFNDEIGRRTP
jgi:hypothetical protein